MGISAYKSVIRESETPRNLERRILARITGDLERRWEDFDYAEDGVEQLSVLASGLRDALEQNIRFWAVLRHDLASPGNALPPDLRAGLLSLALWVERQTSAVLGGTPGVAALVEVNRSVLAGLSGQTAALEEA